jgi:hypothetical protein
MGISVVAVGLFLLTGLVMYLIDKKYFWYCAMLYIAQLWTIISCAYIESGIYITEQHVDSFATGATLRLVLFNIVFFLSYIAIMRLFDHVILVRDIRTSYVSREVKFISLAVIVGSVLLLYINIIQSGIPLFSGSAINKFTFWKESAIYPGFARFLSYSPFYGFILGFIYSNSTDKLSKRSSLVILMAYLIYQMLEGHKFSLPYATIASFLIPFIPSKVTETSRYSVWQKGKLLLMVVVGIIIVFELSKFYSAFNNVEDTTSDVLYRIFGLQGHVWWGTDLLEQTTNIDHYRHFVTEMRELFNSRELPIDAGILFLTILLGGDTGYDFVVRIGGAYTMGYPAISLYTFGTWGTVLLQVFFSIILAMLVRSLHFHIKSGYLIRSVLLYKLLWSTYNALTMGNFGDLFNIKSLVFVGGIIFISCITAVSTMQGAANIERS